MATFIDFIQQDSRIIFFFCRFQGNFSAVFFSLIRYSSVMNTLFHRYSSIYQFGNCLSVLRFLVDLNLKNAFFNLFIDCKMVLCTNVYHIRIATWLFMFFVGITYAHFTWINIDYETQSKSNVCIWIGEFPGSFFFFFISLVFLFVGCQYVWLDAMFHHAIEMNYEKKKKSLSL